jgi:hypothetical protein
VLTARSQNGIVHKDVFGVSGKFGTQHRGNDCSGNTRNARTIQAVQLLRTQAIPAPSRADGLPDRAMLDLHQRHPITTAPFHVRFLLQ